MISCTERSSAAGTEKCGQPAIQFILYFAHMAHGIVPGVPFSSAFCEEHRIIPYGARDLTIVTEEEYVVFNVMDS